MAKAQAQRSIFVYANWQAFSAPTLMGTLRAAPSKGKEVFSFEYDDSWLKNGFAQVLDPDLGLYRGRQYLSDEEEGSFGLFLDSSPDRWGRLLMRRREAATARVEKRREKTLFESDYLLGVFDGHRMGGLRFKTDPDGPFLNDNKRLASPPWTSLRELEHASLELEREDAVDNPDYLKWLSLLIAPGSSLGGARPKASVVDSKGNLWIGKFPSRHDDYDISAWEMVVHELARESGLRMAASRLEKFSGRHHTFLTKRFDRSGPEERIHFSSAMTMLGHVDGARHDKGDASYLELVEFIVRNGARVSEDLEELWRRVVFYICVSNTDDHLRNHGFLLSDKGWELSPAYDINPNPDGAGLKLNISETDNSLELEVALSVIKHFRVAQRRADEIVGRVKDAVSQWEKVAKKMNLSATDRDLMRPAFSAVREP